MEKLENCLACSSQNFQSIIQTRAQMHPSDETFNFDQCNDCGLVFLNPRVSPKNLKAYYTDFYLPYRGDEAWGKYKAQVAGSQHKLDQKRVALIKKHHELKNTTTLLDVGCGKPSFLQKCYDRTKCKAIGIDFTEEGWKNNPKDYQNLQLIVGEVEDLPSNLKPDVITMWHYLEHDYDPIQHLSALKEIAHEQTTLIIEVPNFESESRKKFGNQWAGYHTPRHTALYSPSSIKTLLNNSGWETTTINSYGTLDPYVLYWMSKMEQKGIQWNKNMEEEFVGFVVGMIGFFPQKLREKSLSLGIMTAVAKPRQ